MSIEYECTCDDCRRVVVAAQAFELEGVTVIICNECMESSTVEYLKWTINKYAGENYG